MKACQSCIVYLLSQCKLSAVCTAITTATWFDCPAMWLPHLFIHAHPAGYVVEGLNRLLGLFLSKPYWYYYMVCNSSTWTYVTIPEDSVCISYMRDIAQRQMEIFISSQQWCLQDVDCYTPQAEAMHHYYLDISLVRPLSTSATRQDNLMVACVTCHYQFFLCNRSKYWKWTMAWCQLVILQQNMVNPVTVKLKHSIIVSSRSIKTSEPTLYSILKSTVHLVVSTVWQNILWNCICYEQ